MKPILLLLLLASTAFAAPPVDCDHRQGHADDANKISPAQVVEAGLKKDEAKSIGDKPFTKGEKSTTLIEKPLGDEAAPKSSPADALQGVVGPEKKEEIKEVKLTEKTEDATKKLPALTKDKVEKKSTEKDINKADASGEKFLDLNIKNVVPKDETSTKTKKDDLVKTTVNAEESELGDDATVAVAQQAAGVLDTANKSLNAVSDALGKDAVSVDTAVVKDKNATAVLTPNATFVAAKKEVAEEPANKPKARQVANVAKAPGGVKFDVPLTDTKKDGVAKTERDLPIETLKDTKGVPEPPKASQNQMVISDEEEQGDEAVAKDQKKDLKEAVKDTKDTSKLMSDEAVPAAKAKDAKDAVKDTKDTSKMMSDEALPATKAKDAKDTKDTSKMMNDMAPAPAGIEAPKDISKDKVKKNEPMMMSDEALPAAKAKDTKEVVKDTKDTSKMMSDEAAKPAEGAKLDLDKTKAKKASEGQQPAKRDVTSKTDANNKAPIEEALPKAVDTKSTEKKDAPVAADNKPLEEATKTKTRRTVSTRMMKKGLAGRNTPGFMTGSLFINV